MSGYIRLYRGWRDCEAFCDERLSEREAWLWLLENAAYRPAKRRNGKGEIITIERGQIHVSDRSLASAWDWDKKHVRRFLDRLSDCGMVDQSRDQSGTILSITNYEKYQSPANDVGTGLGANQGPAEDQPRTTHKEGKEGKEGPNGPSQSRAKPDTRLPNDWKPEPLIAGSPSAEIVAAWQPGRMERELSKFRDHYRAAPGAKGLARDWQAKWRTWIGNADGFGGSGGAIRQNRGTGARTGDGFANALGAMSGFGGPQH